MGTNGTGNDKPKNEMEYWFHPANRELLEVGAPRQSLKLCRNVADARFVTPVFTLILVFFLYQTWSIFGWLDQRLPHDWPGVWQDFEPRKFWGTFGYLLLMGLLMRIAWTDRARLNKIRADGVLVVGEITDCTLREIHDDVTLIVCFELTSTASQTIRGCRHLRPDSEVRPGAKVTALVLGDGQYALL